MSVYELVSVVVGGGRNGDRGLCAITQRIWQWRRLSNQGLLVLSSPCTYRSAGAPPIGSACMFRHCG